MLQTVTRWFGKAACSSRETTTSWLNLTELLAPSEFCARRWTTQVEKIMCFLCCVCVFVHFPNFLYYFIPFNFFSWKTFMFSSLNSNLLFSFWHVCLHRLLDIFHLNKWTKNMILLFIYFPVHTSINQLIDFKPFPLKKKSQTNKQIEMKEIK